MLAERTAQRLEQSKWPPVPAAVPGGEALALWGPALKRGGCPWPPRGTLGGLRQGGRVRVPGRVTVWPSGLPRTALPANKTRACNRLARFSGADGCSVPGGWRCVGSRPRPRTRCCGRARSVWPDVHGPGRLRGSDHPRGGLAGQVRADALGGQPVCPRRRGRGPSDPVRASPVKACKGLVLARRAREQPAPPMAAAGRARVGLTCAVAPSGCLGNPEARLPGRGGGGVGKGVAWATLVDPVPLGAWGVQAATSLHQTLSA